MRRLIVDLHTQRWLCLVVCASLLLTAIISQTGCRRAQRSDRAAVIDQAIQAKKTKSDNLRDAMRYLKQLTPVTRDKVTKEVLVQLNTWIENVPKENFQYSTPALYQPLPADWASRQDINNPAQLTFDAWDVDYLFQCKLMRNLADWIIATPVRDRLLQPSIDGLKSKLDAKDAAKFEEAYKLFDWSIRNISLVGTAKDVEKLTLDPRGPLREPPVGCSKLPWETVLYSEGDFVERGRVFTALAHQRGIDTVWVSINGTASSPGYLWAIGVPIAGQLYLFESKLGMPIVDPDTLAFATLKDARENERILARLDLPGQFDYVVNPGDLASVALLVDALPTSMSARMKVLEKSLLGSDRMSLFVDSDALTAAIRQSYPNDPVVLWKTPLLARDFAVQIREILRTPSQAAAQYISAYGVWFLDTPAAQARFQHLKGTFESTNDEEGALTIYMKCRVDDETIGKMSYDPDIQKEYGIIKDLSDTKESFEAKVLQSQMLYAVAKVDANFLLAQLHYDRGNFEATVNWLEKRILPDKRAEKWHAASSYLLARAQIEQGQNDLAEEKLIFQPSPQEPGNRLRLRILRREKPATK
ncbi:MAG: CDC27 family protein [Pirellulaceae bacterium]|nr:CDC27 family protein [Pirellulaceae bacterium]